MYKTIKYAGIKSEVIKEFADSKYNINIIKVVRNAYKNNCICGT